MSENPMDALKSRFARLLELRESRDINKAAAKKSEAAYRECEAELFAAIKEAGITGRIGFDFGGNLGSASFQTRSTKYGRIIDSETAISALKAEGLDDVIYQEAVRERRLNELVRDRLESTAPLPDGVDWYSRDGISISRRR